MGWAASSAKRVRIPTTGSRTSTTELNDYSGGMDAYVSNDKFPVINGGTNRWRLAQDARIPTLGEYETRRGFDFHSDAAGVTQNQVQTSTTGTADQSFNAVTRLAQKWTASASGRLTKLEVRLKNDAAATGTVLVEHWTDSGGSPGVLVARSSIAASGLTGAYAYLTARFADAPSISNGTSYWIVVYTQADASGSYKWSSTTSATTAKSSVNSGSSWSTTTYALNFKQHYATDGAAKGFHRAYKSDGSKVTLLAAGTSLYSVNEVTGVLTAIKTGLNASASRYRFKTVNDIVYYCNEYDGLRKLSGAGFSTDAQVTATNYSNLEVHKGLLFLNRTDDPNRWDFSNFADYETFTSTDFIYVPSPKTGDPTVSARSINGFLLIRTLNSAYILSGDDNATFSLDPAPDKRGSYTQETTTDDGNFEYYLAEDGVYRSNGSEGQLLSQAAHEDIRALQNKDDAVLHVNKGRLYLWFRSAGSAYNDRCYIWNLAFADTGGPCLESLDTNAYVSHAATAFRDDDELMVASSLVGQVYWQERSSNDYTNLGGDINYELQTHYLTGGSPAVLKQYRSWQPRFGAADGSYSIDCQYAYDQRDNWQTQSSVAVQGSGSLWGSVTWGSFTWGSTAEVQASLYVPGEYRRTAFKYSHHATRQPCKFLGHTFVVQTRRLR